ncbi:MAG: amidotransferase, partial [Thermodesulfobacteriota bacterium]
MATIHWLQHVPFEGLGSMEEHFSQLGHELQCTRLWAGDILPAPESVTGLIVMGGPMSVHDE